MKPGVVYLSRLPYRMSVERLSEELSVCGELGRIYLRPSTSRRRRQGIQQENISPNNYGRTPSTTFEEGWVEFLDKRDAKACEVLLNTQPVGGRSRNRDDLWNIRYLHRFSWEDLKAFSAADRVSRKRKLEAAVFQIDKENSVYYNKLAQSRNQRRHKSRKTENDEPTSAG
eukprot:Gregarina_sp_Poly_1__1203@NODE_1296_length_4462_cov_58_443231_g876_i0_p2_GENE_NODE_1296_length_4462_cov_58_443231_g876_i0NODE_1296_length_4462_cov_58_443231_g876_i0_p2_ORF_typecomplete_len171_score19_54RRM_1/PF00076_22/2e06_NODE_1296_length_4462_cov_58_443231_g876_i038134325